MERMIRDIYEKLSNNGRAKKIILALSIVVVFVVTYLLILPALTLDKDKAAEQGGISIGSSYVTAGKTASGYMMSDDTDDSDTQEDNGGYTDSAADNNESNGSSSGSSGKTQLAGNNDAAGSSYGESVGKTGDRSGNNDNTSDNSVLPDNSADIESGSGDDIQKPGSEETAEALNDEESESDTYSRKKATLKYEDDELSVKAVVSDTAGIPDDAELVVTQITKKDRNYKAYMTALNRGFADNPYNSNNSLLYDVSVIVNGEEYEPQDGSIDVSMKFKDKQLTQELGLEEGGESAISIIHLPVVSEDEAGDGLLKASDIEKEYVADISASIGKSESVNFTLDSLSVITVSGASANITINGSLSGTDRTTLDYPLYAYLKPENGGQFYGAKLEFSEGNVSAVIPNVPVGNYTLYLVYPNIKYRDDGSLENFAQLNTPRENESQVLDPNTTKWVSADGGNIFGYYADFPDDTTITADGDKSVSFELKIPSADYPIDVETIMDRALNYGITAENVVLLNNCYTNVAAKTLRSNNQNGNGGTNYNSRTESEPVPNIIGNITLDNVGQELHTYDKSAVYYVPSDQTAKVKNSSDVVIRNRDEIEDRVEIMISNTLKQTETLMDQSMLKIAKGSTSVDVSAYPDNATIIFDATDISGEQNGFTIVKRPGQTIVFNIGGVEAAVPQKTKVKLVNADGEQIDIEGNPSNKIYTAGDQMKNAAAVEGNVWNKLIWNFPEATNVKSSNEIGGIFLVPNGSFNVGNKGGGWIVARHDAIVDHNEWYAFPGTDIPFERKTIRKVFVGLTRTEIDQNYYIDLMTHTNDSTSGTSNNQHVTNLVINKQAKKEEEEAIRSGLVDNVGYENTGTDSNGNIYYEWLTPDLSVGSEHKLSEYNATSTGNNGVEPYAIEFEGGFSAWHEDVQRYMWEMRHLTYNNVSGFNDTNSAVFNVRSYKQERAEYDTVEVTNYYKQEPHKLEVSKIVSGISDDENEYVFAIRLIDTQNNPLSGPVTYTIGGEEKSGTVNENGVLNITLKAGETAVLAELPFGTKYIVEEQNVPDNCEVSYSGDTNGSSDNPGILYQDRSVTVTNTYTIEPDSTIKVHKVWKKANGEPLYDYPEEITYDIYQVSHTHDWGDWTVETEATEESEGLERRECRTDAAHYETRTISKLPHTHDWGDWTVVLEPTSTSEGLEQRVCSKDSTHVETRSIPKIVLPNTILGTTDLVLDESVDWPAKASYPDQNTQVVIEPSGVFQYGDKYYVVYQRISNTAGQFYNGPSSQNNNCVALTNTILTSANVGEDQNHNMRVKNANSGDLYRADDGTYFVCIDAGNVQNNNPPTAQSYANCWYKIPGTGPVSTNTTSAARVRSKSTATEKVQSDSAVQASSDVDNSIQNSGANAAIEEVLTQYRNREGYNVQLYKTVTLKHIENADWTKETIVDIDTADTIYYYYVVERSPATGYSVSYSGQDTGAKAGDTVEITNTQEDTNPYGVELPSTGGIGTTLFYVLGILLVAGAASVLVVRRRA